MSLEYVHNVLNNNLINKEKVTKDTIHIKHHFHDLNTTLILWILVICVKVINPDMPYQSYIYIYIYIFSKYGDVQPMHNKDSNSVYEALLNSFKLMTCPMSIYSDDDSAFKAKVK